MAVPTYSVVVYFDLPVSPVAFQLDNGALSFLDSFEYKLYESTPVDITADVTSVSLTRGSDSRLFPDAVAGTATVTINNDESCSLGARTYDPMYTSSPYYGNIIPGRRVDILAAGVRVFTGRVQDWNLSYDVSGRSVVIMSCADGLATLARQEFNAWTATASQSPGARIATVLNRTEVQWPGARSLDTGVSVLKGDSITFGTNVLQYLNQVVKSDVGLLFVAKDGVLTFKDRHASLNATSPTAFGGVSGIPYSGLDVIYGSELLFNRIAVNSDGFATNTTLELTSQLIYGVSSYSTPTLLLSSSTQMTDVGAWLASTYSNPEFRIAQLRIDVHSLTASQQDAVLALDIASLCTVSFTPNSTGSPFVRTCLVLAVRDEMLAGSHIRTLSFTDVDGRAFFQLNDTVFGVLDTDLLAF
jgi:hypothetical protein